ncbi:MAG: NADH-quinone oxidoreductase subunit NuoF [Rickettsiales bacterium]|nr:MAG: NADH-quinone oxidoreductase subunit NuoF [Rickettsiales bacterium]
MKNSLIGVNVIKKIKEAGLLGRGGAAFPVADKWSGVKNATGDVKYIIVNSSEGELGLFKDLYVWRNHIDKVFGGIRYAIDFLDCPVEIYIHINQDYYEELKPAIYSYINNYKWTPVKFHFAIERPCYVGGEASALLNNIETGVLQPKPRLHRTVEKGLFDKPTMMNNVETFHDVCRVLDGDYDNSRFYGIWGDGVEQKFIFRGGVDLTIAEILKQADIDPDFDYFVQIGGSASGPVHNSEQLNAVKMVGGGGIEIFNKAKRSYSIFMKRLTQFYADESCGKCNGKKYATELNDMVQADNFNEKKITEIITNMNTKTFCKLCKSLKTPYFTYHQNIMKEDLAVNE